ncbi:SAM-dependent methyltransferase [Streptomyces sp. NBC_00825]|uniref:SAM-dependent methyltransferase n=1 Tax=unclassified Streptomyces TaxID=2593676 RepID=UPI002ED05CE5|nr:SAM-dependent methyltransferase [Streptomyces sp. NBC_00826]WTH88193.1 SAM-dependent methyltransferase [Streptomyces sp. NBC_00825]WTH96921.1 SAM-dependent methyltransferase [Streptomyces sp. NBC_00822]
MERQHVDLSLPSAARMYDWLLGGSNNYEVDRVACELLLEVAPTSREIALNNRWFLQRVVRVLAEEHGIKQFIDFGSGLPTQRNVHQIAQDADAQSRVVYIDNDPVVLALGQSLLDENDNTAILPVDMTDTDAIFGHPDFRRLIDFTQPVAALFVSVLHCLSDSVGPKALVERVVDKLAPGSFVVVCQLVSDDRRVRDDVTNLMKTQTGGNWGRVREKTDVEEIFEKLLVEEPGLVDVTDWRPDSDIQRRQRSIEWTEFGGLGRVPPREYHQDGG